MSRRGPKPGTVGIGGNRDKVRRAWGENAPDWILELARQCDRAGQPQVAERIGYSTSAVSTVINGKYKADLTAVEMAVRGAFMAAVVDCPVRGTLPSDICQAWQKKSKTYVSSNAQRVRMFRACRTCPRNLARVSKEETDHVE